jgi:hypothetical protein
VAGTIRYGLEFQDKAHEGDIELNIWRHYDEYSTMTPELLPREQHMRNAIEILFPERYILQQGGYELPKRGYIWNKWMERRCRAWTSYDYQTWWGASATGKSTDAAVLALCTWLASPENTTVIICSTTKPMLEKRIWREIVKFYRMREGEFPGKLVPSDMAIYYDKAKDPLSGIHGVAVKRGSIEDALGDMIGMHNEYVYLIIDEMQSTHEAAETAWDNLSSGCIAGGFLGMGNPCSKLDPLGVASEPKKGWKHCSTQLEEWETKKGMCLYFDGLKSPGVDDPVRFPFLLTERQIKKMEKDPGKDSPRFWQMRRGFLPPDGISWAVMTENTMAEYHVRERVDFIEKPIRVAGIDPSYSQGGDKCIIYPADVGKTSDGSIKIQFMAPIRIALAAREGELLLKTLRMDICNSIRLLDIEIQNIGIDTTGNQWILADAIEEEMSDTGLLRIKSTDVATRDPISINDSQIASNLYKNYGTELWGRFGSFVNNDMIRNLDVDAATQFCVRQLDFVALDTRKVVIESKDSLRTRLGRSPDEADGAVIACEVVRRRLGILPMTSKGAAGSSSLKKPIDILAAAEQKIVSNDGFHEELDDQYYDFTFEDGGF